MNYNQFCPIAKATEILGERWTLLIVREILMGGSRFNELQRGLGDISPALLTSRLKSLEDQGMVVRRKVPGQRSFEYHPTEACKALLPVLLSLGEWAICWARHNILDQDFDAEFLMFYLERSIDPGKLVGNETVIKFQFSDLREQPNWWLLIKNDRVDVCLKDPGRDIDVFFNCSVRTMAGVWMGDRSYSDAIKSGDLRVQGDLKLTRNIRAWLKPSVFEHAARFPPREEDSQS
jgi:DNA-binding HxlR family transcriptional regulator